jgi:hypothetical protein
MLSTLGVLATEKEKEFKKFEEFRSSRRRRQKPGDERRVGRFTVWRGAVLVGRSSRIA